MSEINTSQLLARVMKQWSPPAYYVLTEVRNATGYGEREGYCDALIMSVWPSRGLELIGAELKVSRSDWKSELAQPEKAAKFVKYCHRWYIISANDAVQEHEVPAAWGWMAAGDKGLKACKAAPALTPEPPSHGFLASIFRNAAAPHQGMVSASDVDKLVNQKVEAERKEVFARMENRIQESNRQRDEHDKLCRLMREFSNATGINLDTWRLDEEMWKKEAELFRNFKDQKQSFKASLEGLGARATEIGERIKEILK